MNRTHRVLLVEQVDATGGAPADARERVAALREAGCTVETIVLDGSGGDDLQFATRERDAGSGIEILTPDSAGLDALAHRVRTARIARVLWASAAPGGGEAAHALPRGMDAWWWPAGHAPQDTIRGPLPALPGFAPPGDGSASEPVRTLRNRLSLWDGPFVLVPAPPSEETARGILDAFAQAADGRDEVDLVVLDHPRRRLESLANARGVGLRVHFVGPAPREAEYAWLSTAALALVPGDAPLSGGLLLRALGLGSAPVAVGEAAAPIGDWFESLGCAWARPGDAEGVAEAIERALDRDDSVQRARERGREAARRFDVASLASRLALALGAGGVGTKAA